MTNRTRWAVAVLAFAALGLLVIRALVDESATAGAPTARAVAPTHSSTLSPSIELVSPAPTHETARVEAAPASEPETTAQANTPPPALLVGYVLDLGRRPVSGLEVRYETLDFGLLATKPAPAPAARATSAADGRFELPLPEGSARIVAAGAGYATVRAPTLAGHAPPEPPLVFVGPECAYAGVVVGPDGQPVAGARVAVRLDRELALALGSGGLLAMLSAHHTTTNELGEFEFASIGFAPESRLEAEASGFEPASLPLPGRTTTGLLIQLAPLARGPLVCAGRVLTADRRPAAGAYVAAGGEAATCDEEGRFVLSLNPNKLSSQLRAVLPGSLPAEVDLAQLSAAQRRKLELVLGGAGLTITGLVRDAEGRAIGDARVWTTDGESFGAVATKLGDVTFHLSYSVEGMIDGLHDGQKDGRATHSGRSGAFELKGLVARRYRLWALHPRTFELLGPVEVEAGARAVELVLAGEAQRARVAGRVTNWSGDPLENVLITVARAENTEGSYIFEHSDPEQLPVRTDAQGRFEFAELCLERTRLHLSLEGAGDSGRAAVSLADFDQLESLELRLPAACYLRVTLADAERADSLTLLDAQGQTLALTIVIGGARCSANSVSIVRGVTDRISTNESAATLVLSKEGQEVDRLPIRLTPGGVNELRF